MYYDSIHGYCWSLKSLEPLFVNEGASVGILNSQERRTLVKCLFAIPNITDEGKREALLINLPLRIRTSISNERSADTHIARIIDTVDQWGQWEDGSWPILI